MSPPLVYVDTSAVRQGALKELKGAIKELVAFVEANEPQVIAYNVYLNDNDSQVTVVHVHADSASLEYQEASSSPIGRRVEALERLRHARRLRPMHHRAGKLVEAPGSRTGALEVVVRGRRARATPGWIASARTEFIDR